MRCSCPERDSATPSRAVCSTGSRCICVSLQDPPKICSACPAWAVLHGAVLHGLSCMGPGWLSIPVLFPLSLRSSLRSSAVRGCVRLPPGRPPRPEGERRGSRRPGPVAVRRPTRRGGSGTRSGSLATPPAGGWVRSGPPVPLPRSRATVAVVGATCWSARPKRLTSTVSGDPDATPHWLPLTLSVRSPTRCTGRTPLPLRMKRGSSTNLAPGCEISRASTPRLSAHAVHDGGVRPGGKTPPVPYCCAACPPPTSC